MGPDEHLLHLRQDGERMAELAAGDLSAPVPTCLEWTLAELIEHTGYVHRWQTAAVRDDPPARPDASTWRHPPADGETLAAWFRAGLEDALAVIGAADPTAARWTWAGPATVAWYARRLAQETLVHRIDAELAAGVDPAPVDPALAVDGIDEICDVMIPASVGEPVGGQGETVHLHPTDGPGEWLLTLRADRIDVERAHAKGDVAVRGEARDLLLLAWGRPPVGEPEVFGDGAALERFREAMG